MLAAGLLERVCTQRDAGVFGQDCIGMVRATERLRNGRTLRRVTLMLVAAAIACLLVLGMAGCSEVGTGASTGKGSADTSVTSGHMAGPPLEVHISQATVGQQPAPWVLTTPESAVRSFLAWTAYAYRIGQSEAATRTMSATEEVQVDSYCQYNLEKGRLLDETLTSIAFGKASVGATHTLVPTKESWKYSYLSVKEGNATLGGPYSAEYETTYTVVKNTRGEWLVDSVKAKPLGTVK
jgi:hypothetical protein